MNKMRKTIAVVLAVAMVFTSVNVPFGTAFAQENTTEQPVINDGAKVEEQANAENSPVEAPNATIYVAKIGETQYESLDAAIDAAQAGDTVTLISDVELSAMGFSGLIPCIKIKKDLTLDLNRHTIKYEQPKNPLRFVPAFFLL